MKYRLLNYLACPYCKDKGFPLKLVVIETSRYEERRLPTGVQRPLCDLYCSHRGDYVNKIPEPPCDECIKFEVKTGVLYCPTCSRWYPIIDEIPRVLPDNYRKPSEDVAFLKTYEGFLPEEVKLRGKPHNLSALTGETRSA